MNMSLRLALAAGAVAAGLVGMSCLLRESAPAAAAGVARASAAEPWVDLWHVSDDLDARHQFTNRKIATKRHLAQELIAGRLTLLETAAQFRALDRAHAEFVWSAFRRQYPAATDDESHCLCVIATAQSEFPNRSRQEAAIGARLRAELQEHLKRGPLCLDEQEIQ